jgi:pimeloyl-ACP methyl ester carboxylesterase
MMPLRARLHLLLVIVAMVLGGCATVPPGADTAGAGAPPATAAASVGSGSAPQAGEGRPPTSSPGVQRARAKLALPREVEDAILAIDPAHVTDAEIRGPLAHAPAPRVILLHGGIYPVHLVMVSFGHFLTEMGYPERAIRDPGNGDWSYSPYENADVLAGMVAWQYEHDGMRPMLIGHSQGGMQAVKILHELAGHFTPDLKVFDPVRHAFEDRTTIVDPITGRTRSAVGVSVCYASVVGAGGAAFLLPNQWDMVGKLRSIPDTVDDFTGYFIALDLIAWSFPGANEEERFRAEGSASVRNIELPGSYNHVMLPAVAQLGQDPDTRAAINAYTPGSTDGVAADTVTGAAWAADVWYGIKRHWVSELQRLIRAQRSARPIGTTAQETVVAH